MIGPEHLVGQHGHKLCWAILGHGQLLDHYAALLLQLNRIEERETERVA